MLINIKSSLRNKRVALITGGTTGIGRATALCLARDGFLVAVNYKDQATGREALSLSEELGKIGGGHSVIRANITKRHELKKMLSVIKSRYGRLDALVNNAGINQNQNFGNLNFKDFDHILNINLRGVVEVTKIFLPLLRKKKTEPSSVIFISSVNAFIGSPSRLAYVVSKSGVLGVTKALALELAPKILVNAVVPGYINTRMLAEFKIGPLSEKIDKIPLKRIGRPEEVAELISFLCSKKNSYITGQTIHINGGLFLS